MPLLLPKLELNNLTDIVSFEDGEDHQQQIQTKSFPAAWVFLQTKQSVDG